MSNDASTGESFAASAFCGLLHVVESVTPRRGRPLAEIADALLHHPRPGSPCDTSDLSANGSPLQALLSARRDRWVVRLIGDPAFDRADPVARLAASREAVAATLALGSANALTPLASQTIDAMVPADAAALASYPTGMLRTGVAVEAPGAAIYAGPCPSEEPWAAASRWAAATFHSPAVVSATIATLSRECALLGVGVEGTEPANARAKLYWRPSSLTSLRSFGLPLFEHPAILLFLTRVMGRDELPLGALNFSAGFHPGTGALSDIKVDVARSDLETGDALGIVNGVAERLGLEPPRLDGLFDCMNEARVGAACLGLGIDLSGAVRINTYLYQR